MKILLAMLTLLMVTGCEKEVQKVYVDANGTEIVQKPKFKTFERDIECDSRGYAYYVENTYAGYSIHTPIFKNHTYGAYQVTCED